MTVRFYSLFYVGVSDVFYFLDFNFVHLYFFAIMMYYFSFGKCN